MKIVKAEFIFEVSKNHHIKVLAKAKDVDPYGAEGLRITLLDSTSGKTYLNVPDSDTMEAIEAQALEELYSNKYELNLGV